MFTLNVQTINVSKVRRSNNIYRNVIQPCMFRISFCSSRLFQSSNHNNEQQQSNKLLNNWYWVYLYRATIYNISISMHFTSIFPGYGTCSFQYQLNSLGSIQPCCHHGGSGNYYTQAITVQPGTHSLLGRESAHTGEVSCPRTQRQPRQPRPYPRPFSPKSQAIVTAP